ncbi:MAG: DUF3830 family protein [Rhodospirillales bacterium]|nr:DUF3830 family protein [Rhodospirillales bacterium]
MQEAILAQRIRISEARSGLDVTAALDATRAPANAGFLWNLLAEPRAIPGVHAMWTGPEISCPVPDAMLADRERSPLPVECGTVMPQPGEIVLTYLPARFWGGGEAPVFDIGLFYGPQARLFFPVGWIAGSVVGRVADVAALAAACAVIRRHGQATLSFARMP